MILEKAREAFSKPIAIVDEEGQELTKSDIARRQFQSQRWAWVGAEEKNLLHNSIADDKEQVLKSHIAITSELIDKGRDDLLANFKHLQARYDKFDEENINTIAGLVKATSICKDDFLDSHLDLIKSLTRYADFMYKKLMPYNKGVGRKNMPQIDDNDKKKKELDLKEVRVGIGELRPFQSEIDQDKVTSFLAGGYSIPNSWIISKDNYIMDGHHRWAASLEIYEPEEQITAYQSDLDAEELHAQLMGVEKGIYVNNFENKKKGRVGQHYGIEHYPKKVQEKYKEYLHKDFYLGKEMGAKMAARMLEREPIPEKFKDAKSKKVTALQAALQRGKEIGVAKSKGLGAEKSLKIQADAIRVELKKEGLTDKQINKISFAEKKINTIWDQHDYLHKLVVDGKVEVGGVKAPTELQIAEIGLKHAMSDKQDAEQYLKEASKNMLADKVGYNKDKLKHAKKTIKRLKSEIDNLTPKLKEPEKKELYKYKGQIVVGENKRKLPNGVEIIALEFSDGQTSTMKMSSFKPDSKDGEFSYHKTATTGKPITFDYIKNTEKAPNMGNRYGQDVEPSGFYITQKESTYIPPNYKEGTKTLNNPLVVQVNNETLVEWKRDLSKEYGGKKNKKLTEALVKEGYDGIITQHENGYLGEIIVFNHGGKVEKINTLADARKVWAAMEAGKDRGNYEAKMNYAGIPNSASGYSEEMEAEAWYVIKGNKFLEHSYEKIKEMQFPNLTTEQFNEQKSKAEKKFGHLQHIRDQYMHMKKAEDFTNALKTIDEGLYKSFVSMPLEEFVKEHKELVDVLLHGTEEEQAKEAESQQSELQQYFDKEKAKKLKHYAVGIYQRWEDNKILFLQRTFDDEWHPSTWNLPGGGIDTGETPEEAVRREFKEETNLEVDTCWGARVVTEGDAMIHYFWVIPKNEAPIALLDSESQQYAFWDESEFVHECTILSLEKHLLAILNDEEIVKGEQLSIKGKAGLVEKKVLVHRKGSKPFWQTKWVKALDKPKLPLKKKMSLLGVAKYTKINQNILKDIVPEIDKVMIEGDEYDAEFDDGYFNLTLTGVGEKKKGWHVVLKNDTTIEKKGKAKKATDDEMAEKIIHTAYKSKKPLDVAGEKYKIVLYSKSKNWVEFMINGGSTQKEPFKEFAKMISSELTKKKAAFAKQKQYKNPDVNLKDDDFKEIKNLGGSTGAMLVEDKDGVQWVRKGGKNKGHRMEELLAITLYKTLGVNVSNSTKTTKDYMYNRYIEGDSLGKWRQGKSDEEVQKMYDKISANFVVDALLGNWDVVGLEEDNIIIDKSGSPIRIDVGGSLRYRAQGEKKKDAEWNANVTEVETLRDLSKNKQSARVFAGLTATDIMKQVDALPASISSWVDLSVRKTLNDRIDFLKLAYEGLPTNLKDMGDLYDIPKDATPAVKSFYTKLNKMIDFSPRDQKVLTLMAENGDNTAATLASEEKATSYINSEMHNEELFKEYTEKLGLSTREMYAINQYTGGIYRSVNTAIRTLISGEWNIVEEGKVVKYKPEFEDEARKAFDLNNVINDALMDTQQTINLAHISAGGASIGHYGVSKMQRLRELDGVLAATLKKPKNDIDRDIAKFYKGHTEGLLNAFNKKDKYEKEIGVYIPSEELKEKYAEIVDLSLTSNPVQWEDIIKTQHGEAKSISDLKGWAQKDVIKMLLLAKLAARGLAKGERFAGKSKVVNNSTVVSRKLSPNNMNQFLDQHQVGNNTFWANISSTSTDFGVWDGTVRTRIMPKGALIIKHFSQHKGEAEHMIKPFPRMRVTAAKQEGGYHYINLKQIG